MPLKGATIDWRGKQKGTKNEDSYCQGFGVVGESRSHVRTLSTEYFPGTLRQHAKRTIFVCFVLASPQYRWSSKEPGNPQLFLKTIIFRE
jgi:hypothetical protein